MHGDWVTAIATLVGAVLGVFATLITEYFRKERKALRFVIETPEDLAQALRSHGSSFELKVDGVSTQSLNASGVTIQNLGNVILTDVIFDVSISGERSLAQAQPSSENSKLVSEIKIKPGISNIIGRTGEPFFSVSIPYLNPREAFKITIFYDGSPTRCLVDCRLPGIRIISTSHEDAQRAFSAGEELGGLVVKLGSIGVAAALAAAITGLIATLTR